MRAKKVEISFINDMQKKPQQISYAIAKAAFGIYLVNELRTACGKEYPTETDVKKFLLRNNPAVSVAALQTARQISRYCQTGKEYIREAREETLDKVAGVLNTSIGNLEAFREKINPLLKAFKYYSHYVDDAEAYLASLDSADKGQKHFKELFSCDEKTVTYLSMISYHFGADNKDLPAVSFGAESDLRTERIISDLFDTYSLQPPQYIPEHIFFDALNKQPVKTNFIAIGLFGNRLTTWMNDNGCLTPTLQVLPAEKCIKLNGHTYQANRSAGIDYALFCKVNVSPNTWVFIIGGIEGFGTQRIGEYLEHNWPVVQQLTASYNNITLLYKTSEDVTLVEKIAE